MSGSKAASSCLDEGRLLAYLNGQLDVDDRASVRAHMVECDRCREWMAAVAAETELTLQLGPARQSEQPEAAFPDTPVRYTATARLGRGAMGEVYRATDSVLHREVALKFVTHRTRIARARLVREARAAARINHPNAVAVHDVGVIDGELFIAMELVEGVTLDVWLSTGRTGREILSAFGQAGRALEAAHAAGVLHRDFKPKNVLVSADGRVRVADFGLARLVSDPHDEATLPPSPVDAGSDDLTATGAVMGTPAYMSPEQRAGTRFDERSDQYSFAVALYQALTGHHPFAAGDALRSFPPRDATLPAGVVDVVARSLEPDPAARWPSMTELLAALDAAVRPARSRRRIGVALALAGAGIAAVAGVMVWTGGGARAEARPRIDAVERLTSNPGCEENPAFSPDGRTIYYDGEVDGDGEIFAIDLATRQTRRLSQSPGVDISPRTSPDGRRLAWVQGPARQHQLRILALDTPGAAPIDAGPIDVGWWLEWASSSTLLVGHMDGRISEIEVDARGRQGARRAHGRSPDKFALWIARRIGDGDRWLMGSAFEGESRLFIGSVATGWDQVVLPDWWYVADSGMAVTRDGAAAYLVGSLADANRTVLRWAIGSDQVDALALSNPGYGIDVSRDGTRLVYSTCVQRSWVARIDRAGAEPVRVLSSLEWDAVYPIPLPGGRMLVSSNRDGADAVWLYDLATGRGESISPPTAFMPAASADGEQLAFIDHPSDDRGGVFVVDAATRAKRQLTSNTSDRSPMFGADGGSIYIVREQGGLRVVRVSIADGTATPQTPVGVADFAVSPRDGAIVAVIETGAAHRVVWHPASGPPKPIERLPPAHYQGPRFSPDGEKLVIVRNQNELVELTVDGDAPAQTLYRAPSTATLRWPAYAVDGDAVFVSVSAPDGDLMLVDGSFP